MAERKPTRGTTARGATSGKVSSVESTRRSTEDTPEPEPDPKPPVEDSPAAESATVSEATTEDRSGRGRSSVKPPKVAKRAGGHTVYVDPPAGSGPAEMCSVHGCPPDRCPEPHESRGWTVGKGK